ncbi:Metal transporter Nramp6 [Galdieria sulphuraria]|nr:Metal transporter Nramp6 [Galdieria sulphuraria]
MVWTTRFRLGTMVNSNADDVRTNPWYLRLYSKVMSFFRFVGPGWLEANTATRFFGLYGEDLASACRQQYPKWTAILLWLFMEATIITTDMVEVTGFAIAIQILFGWPLYGGVLLSCITTLLLLAFRLFGFRTLEILVLLLSLLMTLSFFIEWAETGTRTADFFEGWFVPRVPSGSALVVLAIVGTDVVPQNLYLQSRLVKSRDVKVDDRKEAFISNVIETVIPMLLAFVLNGAIISLAAIDFHDNNEISSSLLSSVGLTNVCTLIKQVYQNKEAGCILWAISLLASGQSTAMTATYTGQIVMEGFIRLHMSIWLRSLLTRCISLIPAIVVVSLAGEKGANTAILIGAAIPSATLPFAVIPLVKFVSSRRFLKERVIPRWCQVALVILSLVLIGFNIFLIVAAPGRHTLRHLLSTGSSWSIAGIVLTAIIGSCYLVFLLFITFCPIQAE